MKHSLLPAIVLFLAAVFVMGQPAAADVRIVSDVTVKAPGTAARRSTVTTSYREGKVRVEPGGDVVLIYDLEAQRVFRLDLARKTYRVLGFGEGAPTGAADRLRAGRPNVRVDVQPAEETRTVAGLTASKRLVVAHVDQDEPTLAGTSPASGPFVRTSGGGYGIGLRVGAEPQEADHPVQRKKQKEREPSALDIQAEYWMTDAVPIGSNPLAALPCIAVTLTSGRLPLSLLEPMLARLRATGKTLPLSSRVVTTPVKPEGKDTVVTTEVQSIATTPLDRLLFCVPSDFTLDE